MHQDSTPDLFDTTPTKRCTRCKAVKPVTEFHQERKNKDGRTSRCKTCRVAACRVWYKANGANRVRVSLLKRYGLTKETYQRILDSQGGVCALCGKPETTLGMHGKIKRLAVDHCHKTGHNRALLCCRCNQGLGYFLHDPNLLKAAIAYLEKHTTG